MQTCIITYFLSGSSVFYTRYNYAHHYVVMENGSVGVLSHFTKPTLQRLTLFVVDPIIEVSWEELLLHNRERILLCCIVRLRLCLGASIIPSEMLQSFYYNLVLTVSSQRHNCVITLSTEKRFTFLKTSV